MYESNPFRDAILVKKCANGHIPKGTQPFRVVRFSFQHCISEGIFRFKTIAPSPLYTLLTALYTLLAIGLPAQNPRPEKPFSVGVRMDNVPAVLHPQNFLDDNAEEILRLIYQPLLAPDPYTLQSVPVLADGLPKIQIDSLGRPLLTFHLRTEAIWDKGRAIVARDVAFSLKAFKCPLVANEARRKILDPIVDIVLYMDDPRKLTLVLEKPTFEVMDALHELFILDPFVYDPSNYLGSFTVPMLDSLYAADDFKGLDRRVVRFASTFNQRDYHPDKLTGSGPYILEPFGMTEDIILKKKSLWWGDLLDGINPYFSAYPSEIAFLVAEDEADAVRRLAVGELDVAGGFAPEAYQGIRLSLQGSNKYYFPLPSSLTYEYMGFNLSNPILRDVRVRRAIAQLIDYSKIISDVKGGYASRINGPVPPEIQDLYNNTLKTISFNPEQAKRALAEAGWKDHDADGLADNIVDGLRMSIRLSYIYSHNQPHRAQIGELLKAAAKQVGIDITVQGFDHDYFQQAVETKGFDLFVAGWVNGPTLNDPAPLFSSRATRGLGYNYTGYGNAETDSLITRVRYSISRTQLAASVQEFQKRLNDDLPVVFLHAPLQPLIVSRRFLDPATTCLSPGCWVQGLRVKSEE